MTDKPTESQASTPNEQAISRFIQVDKDEADALLIGVKHRGLDTVASILRAADDGRITKEERNILIADAIEDVGESAKIALDIVTPLPEPVDTIVDGVISQGVDAVLPRLEELVKDAHDGLRDLLTTDAGEFEDKIGRVARKLAETEPGDRRFLTRRRRRRLANLLRRYHESYPTRAHAFGVRRHTDGHYVRVSR